MSMFDEGLVSLETLKAGAAVQLFNEELDKVLANIMDPNTEANAVRSVKLEIKIKPDKDRSGGSVEIIPSCKLAPAVALGTRMFFGKKGGKFLAFEHNPEELQFPFMREDLAVHAGGKEDEAGKEVKI
jgi:hypothetical protein